MKRAVDIGPVDAAAIKMHGGKIRLRLLFSVEQLEALLAAAQEDRDDAMKRDVTQCNAPEKSRADTDIEDDDDARERRPITPKPQSPSSVDRVFVIEGSRAWDAWVKHKRATSGVAWTMTTSAVVQGEMRRGWYFGTTLFPIRSG